MEEQQYDLVVIGAGPGGYVAAIRAAQLNMKTAIIENREIGGTCLNRGCIPTKTIMHSSHLYYDTKNFENIGLQIEGISYDINKIMDRKDEVIDRIRSGIHSLLKENNITILSGTATIKDHNHIMIKQNVNNNKVDCKDKEDSKEKEENKRVDSCKIENNNVKVDSNSTSDIIIQTDKILIATGSTPAKPKIEGSELHDVVTSDELLSLRDKLYHKLVIIGGGVIGIEFATIYQELGCEVEIIEAMDRILPTMDKEISQSVAMNLKKKGVKIHTKAKVIRISENANAKENSTLSLTLESSTLESSTLECSILESSNMQGRNSYQLQCEYEETSSGVKTTYADGILIAIGRKGYTEGLFNSDFNVDMERDKIKVNSNFETSVNGIYAIGDVIGGVQLAHVASAQGIVAVESMCNQRPSVNLNVIPSCIYTSPEVASVGLNEAEAKEKGYAVKIGKYPMLGNSKTILSMDDRGFIKIIIDSETDKVLGAQLICARATDMVGELATAIANGLTVEDLSSVIRPHPTYLEGVTEAIDDVYSKAIHMLPNRR